MNATIATAARPSEAATGQRIPADRARSLRRWNIALGALHFIQFAAMLGLSFIKDPIVTAPISSSYLSFDQATRTLVQAERNLFNLPIGPAVALFFLASAVAHFTLAFPLRDWYERSLARGQNPVRWLEYAISSSIMIVVIAVLSGIQDIGALIAIFGANASMNLFGWSMEAANEGRSRVQWLHYIFGCFAGAIPWIVIFIALVTASTAPNATGIPGFVIAIFISLFVSFNVFAINMVLQYRKIGRWADYLYGERAYMILSLVAKTLLAWQVFSGTLRP